MKKGFQILISLLLILNSTPVYSDDYNENEPINSSISNDAGYLYSLDNSLNESSSEQTNDSKDNIYESSSESSIYSSTETEQSFSGHQHTDNMDSITESTSELSSYSSNEIEDIVTSDDIGDIKNQVDPYFPLEPDENDLKGDLILPGEIGIINEYHFKKSRYSSINQEIINNLNKGVFKRATIIKDWRTYSMFPYKTLSGGTQNKPHGIVIHETANPNSTIYGEISYMDRNWKNAFVHAFVDQDNIIEIHDPSYGAWGAGRIANQYFMHVELVEHIGNKTAFMKSILNDAYYAASKLHEFGLSPSRPSKNKNDVSGTVWSHNEVSSYLGGTDHTDPTGYFGKFGYTMDDFYELIVYEYNQLDRTYPEVNESKITAIDYDNKTFTVQVKANAKSGIKSVVIPVWTKADQSDIKWLNAKLDKNGYYTVQVVGSMHGDLNNYFQVHGYILGNNGQETSINIGSLLLDNTGPVIQDFVVDSKDYIENKFSVRIKATAKTGILSVRVPVWTALDQGDLQWYSAKLDSSGYYTVQINGNVFKEKKGPFNVHGYVQANNKKELSFDLGPVILDNTAPEIISVDYMNIDYYKGSFDIYIKTSSVSGIKSVQVPVWTKKDQSDLVWYSATLDDKGFYKVTVESNKHYYSNEEYKVHLYVENNAETITKLALANVKLKDNVTTATHSIDNISNKDEKYLISTRLNEGAKVEKVRYAVWNSVGNQSDLNWYDAKYNSKNNQWEYELDFAKSSHSAIGKYIVHSYIYLPSGKIKSYNTPGFEVERAEFKDISVTDRKINAKSNFDIEITAKSELKEVKIPIWSREDQSDMYWYIATPLGNNKYRVQFDYSNHKFNDGKFKIHGYAIHKNGAQTAINLGELEVSIPVPSVQTEIRDISGQETNYLFSLSSTNNDYIKSIEIPVWGAEDGQNDLVWYTAVYNAKNKKWEVEIPISNYNEDGLYFIETYGKLYNGKLIYLKTETIIVTPAFSHSIDNKSNKDEKYLISTRLNEGAKVEKVRYAVWNSVGNQSDLNWYDAKYNSKNNQWEYELDFAKSSHSAIGKYIVHSYIYLPSGKIKSYNTPGFEVERAEFKDISVTDRKINAKSNFDIEITAKSELKEVKIPIWSREDQSDMYWYIATPLGNNKYRVQFDYSNHKFNDGKFKIHGYAIHKNGAQTAINLGELEVSIPVPSVQTEIRDISGQETNYLFSLSSTNNDYIKSIEIPVWGAEDGQNDLVWYTAVYNTKNKKWEVEIPISNHRETGLYFMESYVRLQNNKLIYLKSESIKITQPEITVFFDKTNLVNGKFKLRLTINSKSPILKVEVPIWSEKNQSNLKWYVAKKIDTRLYEVEVDYSNHKYKNGDYTIHAYIYLANGIVQPNFVENILLNDNLSLDKGTSAQFIKGLMGDAQVISKKNGLYPSVMLAQASLESGYGTSILAQNANNYFGMKFKINEDEGKYGAYYIDSKEFDSIKNEWITVKSPFRSYESKIQSLEDYAFKLKNGVTWDSNYYKGTWISNSKNYKEATQSLQGKYATDPQYANKLNSIIEKWRLDQFD